MVNNRRTLLKRLGISITSLLFVAGALEGMAYLAFELLIRDRLNAHWRVDVAKDISQLGPAQFDEFRTQLFDPELGWVFRSDTKLISYTKFEADGARTDQATTGKRFAAAYGDSFTFGENVANDQSWPHFLSLTSNYGFRNYGVAGYGPDQALRRFERHLEAGKIPEVAVLGILSENIARAVNVYRHFYITTSGTLNFKPLLSDDGREWVYPDMENLITPKDVLRAARHARASDYWARVNELRPRPGFPHFLTALDTAHYLMFRVKRWQDLWLEEFPVRKLNTIVKRFVRLSRENGVSPVILMIPMGLDLQRNQRNEPATYGKFLTNLRSDPTLAGTVIVNPLDRDFDQEKFNLRPFTGHASEYGNKLLAKSVASALKSLPPVLKSPRSLLPKTNMIKKLLGSEN
jgi:hypothetical protein